MKLNEQTRLGAQVTLAFENDNTDAEEKLSATVEAISQVNDDRINPGRSSRFVPLTHDASSQSTMTPYIPRPHNAYLFARKYRQAVAAVRAANASFLKICYRLGRMCKWMDKAKEARYYALVKVAELNLKKKYPWYVFNRIEAIRRKALRKKRRQESQGVRKQTSAKLTQPSENIAAVAAKEFIV